MSLNYFHLAPLNGVLFLIAFGLFAFHLYFRVKIPWFKYLLLFSCLPLWSIFRYGTYESGDLSINVMKTIAFYRSLEAGHLIPQWASDLNATYGYPSFLFAYPLPYYLASLFRFLGASFLISVKLVLPITYLLSVIGMYVFLKDRFSARSAFIGALCYAFAPYHLINLHFRIDIGELTALAVLPWAFWALRRHPVIAAVPIALLVLSHQAVALVGVPLLWLYKRTVAPFLLGLGLAAFYWLPALAEGRYTLQVYMHRIDFVTLPQLLYAPWRWGFLFQGPRGELAALLGYAQWGIVILGLALWLRRQIPRPHRLIFGFFALSLALSLVLMLPFSAPLWQLLPLMQKFQFASRLLNVSIFSVSVLAAIVAGRLPSRRWAAVGVFLFLAPTVLNWGHRRMVPEVTDTYFENGLPGSTAVAEGLWPAAPIWLNPADPWFKAPPPTPLEGPVIVRSHSRQETRHRYTLTATAAATLVENTVYFPGWTVRIDQRPVPVAPQNGRISFPVTPGDHEVEVNFLPTPIRRLAPLISLLSLGICGIITAVWLRHGNRPAGGTTKRWGKKATTTINT